MGRGLTPPVKKEAAGWGFKDKAYKACREASSPPFEVSAN